MLLISQICAYSMDFCRHIASDLPPCIEKFSVGISLITGCDVHWLGWAELKAEILTGRQAVREAVHLQVPRPWHLSSPHGQHGSATARPGLQRGRRRPCQPGSCVGLCALPLPPWSCRRAWRGESAASRPVCRYLPWLGRLQWQPEWYSRVPASALPAGSSAEIECERKGYAGLCM